MPVLDTVVWLWVCGCGYVGMCVWGYGCGCGCVSMCVYVGVGMWVFVGVGMWVCGYVCVWVYGGMCGCMYVGMCGDGGIWGYMWVVCMWVCMYVGMCGCMYVGICGCMYVGMCGGLYMGMCGYVWVCGWVYSSVVSDTGICLSGRISILPPMFVLYLKSPIIQASRPSDYHGGNHYSPTTTYTWSQIPLISVFSLGYKSTIFPVSLQIFFTGM